MSDNTEQAVDVSLYKAFCLTCGWYWLFTSMYMCSFLTHRLVARSPFPDAAVETDMMKRTLPPSTRSSTHPSMLTSSHPPLSGSSYPSLPSSAHPPLSSSSHLSAVSSQAYIHGFHSTRENDGQPSVSTGKRVSVRT